MNRFTINFVSVFKSFAFICLLASLTFGCEKETIVAENNLASAQFDGVSQLARPASQCGSSVFTTMKVGATTVGNVEIMNNDNQLYILLDMNAFKFIEQIKIFVGDINDMPLDSDGFVNKEAFPYQYILSNGSNDYTFMVPVSSLLTCNSVVVWTRVSTRNMMGNTTSTVDAWMNGAPIANTFATNYCLGACVTGNNSSMSVE